MAFFSYWEECQQKVVDRVLEACSNGEFDSTELHRMVGVLEINAYEVHGTLVSGHRGLYALASLLNHRCTPNLLAIYSGAPPFAVRYVALTSIKEGTYQKLVSANSNYPPAFPILFLLRGATPFCVLKSSARHPYEAEEAERGLVFRLRMPEVPRSERERQLRRGHQVPEMRVFN